jgi:hypothetical protein
MFASTDSQEKMYSHKPKAIRKKQLFMQPNEIPPIDVLQNLPEGIKFLGKENGELLTESEL